MGCGGCMANFNPQVAKCCGPILWFGRQGRFKAAPTSKDSGKLKSIRQFTCDRLLDYRKGGQAGGQRDGPTEPGRARGGRAGKKRFFDASGNDEIFLLASLLGGRAVVGCWESAAVWRDGPRCGTDHRAFFVSQRK